jgi:hypothetical protein
MKSSPRSAARGDRHEAGMKPKAHARDAVPIAHDLLESAEECSSRLMPNTVLTGLRPAMVGLNEARPRRST